MKGKAAAIVQDAEAYQRLLDIAAKADAGEGIRQRLEDTKEGRVRPAREFFADFEARKTYLVNVAIRAVRDLALILDCINAHHFDAALHWYRRLKEASLNLEERPNLCPQTPENAKPRHLQYGKKPYIYRVILRVAEKTGGRAPHRARRSPAIQANRGELTWDLISSAAALELAQSENLGLTYRSRANYRGRSPASQQSCNKKG